MFLPRVALAALLALGHPAIAETEVSDPASEIAVDRLSEVMRLGDLFQVLREEGVAHGEDLQADMFPSGGGAEWTAEVSDIYDAARLQAAFTEALKAQLIDQPETMDAIIGFFASDLGRRIIGLEIEARRAFLDTATEEAARVAAEDAAAARDPKVALIGKMIDAGDLLEMNVAGALSGSLSFMTGMAETGAYGGIPQDQLALPTIRCPRPSWKAMLPSGKARQAKALMPRFSRPLTRCSGRFRLILDGLRGGRCRGATSDPAA